MVLVGSVPQTTTRGESSDVLAFMRFALMSAIFIYLTFSVSTVLDTVLALHVAAASLPATPVCSGPGDDHIWFVGREANFSFTQ